MTPLSHPSAVVVNAQSMPLGELLGHGGWAMYPIYACSVLALAIFVQKLLELRALNLRKTDWLDAVLTHVRAGDSASAEEACRLPPHPAARVVAAVARALRENPDQVEGEAKRVASLELQKVERNLGMLSFLAQVSPLLGLLGTVLGMVDLFMGLQGAD